MSEWTSTEHAFWYLSQADSFPHRAEGESALIEQLPKNVRRVLDLGTGDGRLLGLVKIARPGCAGVALDFSPPMLEKARMRFAGDGTVRVVEHDLAEPLPDPMGAFDAVVSCFAIHHLEHERKRELYDEVFGLLEPGGVFLNLEHVSSPTPRLHEIFFAALGLTVGEEDPSDRLLDVETQLRWLRETGFADVDCHWKWLELALLGGAKPVSPGPNPRGDASMERQRQGGARYG